ncbi:hypothetical protein [Antrihabitans spumae]|uniref:Uncharacterized protein n=1 Tax=Antrihabitans spumae TaxID=3373370 RepID=A0ABW7KVJ6_9NOCA
MGAGAETGIVVGRRIYDDPADRRGTNARLERPIEKSLSDVVLAIIDGDNDLDDAARFLGFASMTTDSALETG